MKVIISLIISLCAVTIPAMATDLDIWFGNSDGSPLIFRIDNDEKVPVWVQTNSDVYIAAVHIPLSSSDKLITARGDIVKYAPFENENVPKSFDKGWDVASTMGPAPHEGKAGFTSQSLLGFCDLARNPNIPLHTTKTHKILEFTVHTTSDKSYLGKTLDVFIEGFNGPSEGIHFSDTTGSLTYTHEAHFSKVYFLYPGDINDDGKLDNSDIELLTKHINDNAEIAWPEQRADCNNDQHVDKKDIEALRKMVTQKK